MEQTLTSATTAVAVASPAGEGAVATVRVSGPDAISIVGGAWRGRSLADIRPRTATLGCYIAVDGGELDQCVATVFRAPASFTGEDSVELSLHGSRWIQQAVVADLISRGCVMAERGEFSRRAFLNGKIDLAQAEGIADLIAASSRAAHRLAFSQTKGTFSRRLDALRADLIELASLLELELDFSEEDVEFADRPRLLDIARRTLELVDRLAASYAAGHVIADGVGVVIAGAPNAGKSTLLNLLLDDDKAIVSDIPGTTRDVIEATREINGVLYRFIDTAGLRDTDDPVERLGIDRTRDRAARASAVVWLLDAAAPLEPQLKERDALAAGISEVPVITVANKADLLPARQTTADDATSLPGAGIETVRVSGLDAGVADPGAGIGVASVPGLDAGIAAPGAGIGVASVHGSVRGAVCEISAKTGEGIDSLIAEIGKTVGGGLDWQTDLMVTNGRHYESLLKIGEALRQTIAGLETGLSADLIAEDLRIAIHHLGTITGAVTTDTLLSTIFSRFCIGK